ncbi:GHKL domain-containing protein [Adhaeribacter sp. BT258]|uniref:histidine kinase n=1 Tax=Adhaeribacter terrigena TaxID=2793070 RepID=A0ABS1C5M4_9BACT|nr:GHKL domain-containing protein [Adhaeribacter terrigena]
MLRVGLITLAAMLLVLAFFVKHWFVTGFCLGLVIFALIYDLIFFVERTNRELSRFFTAIRHSDFTQRFTENAQSSSFKELHGQMNEMMYAFQKIKSEKEAHYHYLQAIVEHIRIGVFTFDDEGQVQLFNKVAKEVLQVPFVKNVKALERISPELVQAAQHLESGQTKLIKIDREKDQLMLLVSVAGFYSQNKRIRIVSLQNIRSEMEEQELAAWQKLISVLTHEIMNSVTPIISLTSTIRGLVDERVATLYSAEEIAEDENLDDIRTGLQTIEKRSTGMLHFVQNYRRLTRVPPPHLETVVVNDLLKQVARLLQNEPAFQRAELRLLLPETPIKITADPELIEQVLLNLVKNGVEACENVAEPVIELSAFSDEKQRDLVRIEVKDNGPGVPEEILDKIFVPFYTTKKQGSGIGLSLSRQIMKLHHGSLQMRSAEPKGTVFSLLFYK